MANDQVANHADMDALRNIIAKREGLCSALKKIKKFCQTMQIQYSISKDGIEFESQIADDNFLNQASLNFVIDICNYKKPHDDPEPLNHRFTKDQNDFKKYLIEAGYKITKK